MKKIIIAVSALLMMMSCTNESDFEVAYQHTQQEYATMYEFVGELYQSELFDMEAPAKQTYEEMMNICANIVRTDTFCDTFAEGNCEKIYRLMFAYFSSMQPNAEITSYLNYILVNEMY